MRPTALRLAPFLLLALLALPAAAEEPAAPAPTTRQDLAEALLGLEAALEARPPEGAARTAIDRRFDELTRAYFLGRRASVVRDLRRLEARVRGADDERSLALAGALSIEPHEALVLGTGAAPPEIGARLRLAAGAASASAVHLRVVLVDPAGRETHVTMAVFEPAEPQAAEGPRTQDVVLPLPADRPEAAPWGRWRIEVALRDGTVLGRTHVAVVSRPVGPVAEGVLARLEALDAPAGLEDAAHALEQRARLLASLPDADRSAAFLADPEALAAALEREIARLEAGEDPYAGRAGTTWRPVRLALVSVPLLVHVPASCTGETPCPLVVAYHGAGGDEMMFAHGYGRGRLLALAEEHGFVVAAPLTYPTVALPGAALDAIVESVAGDVAIDRERILLLGHSLGAITALRTAAARPGTVRAVAALAGVAALPEATPTLLVLGGEDTLFAPERWAASVGRARAKEVDVTLRIRPGEGHTLLVARVLPDVVAWLLERP